MVDHKTEKDFVDFFNGKNFGDLDERRKEFICMLNDGVKLADDCEIRCYDKTESVAPNVDYESILCNKKQKPIRDVEINFEGKVKKVSLKSGTGNSTHQEIWWKWEKLLKHFKATEEEIGAFDNFLHLILRVFNIF